MYRLEIILFHFAKKQNNEIIVYVNIALLYKLCIYAVIYHKSVSTLVLAFLGNIAFKDYSDVIYFRVVTCACEYSRRIRKVVTS